MDQRPRQLNGFIIDLVYYAFGGVQSRSESVSENRYRSPNVGRRAKAQVEGSK